MEILELDPRDIIIPEDRQRKSLGEIESMHKSLKAHGQLQPIVVEADESDPDNPRYTLVAGERRTRGARAAGLPIIYAVRKSDLSPREKVLIELEENLRRKELEWPEMIMAIQRYYLAANKSQKEVAEDLGIHELTIGRQLKLALALGPHPHLAKASSWSSAYSTLISMEEKATESALEDILADNDQLPIPPSSSTPILPLGDNGGAEQGGTEPDLQSTEQEIDPASPGVLTLSPPPPPPVPARNAYAIQTDFLSWVTSYTGRRFNTIHCDFPYGLGMDEATLQGSSVRWEAEGGRYDDSPELFERLIDGFLQYQDKFIASSAHCIFWCAHKNVSLVKRRFHLAGWTACEVPLIWLKSDNVGIAPDVRRQPRRNYEIAVFLTRGDRKIVKVKNAACAFPTTKVDHLSEKPLDVVRHFLEMICDEYSDVFDPTCGSGTALEIAARLGARHILGLDVIPKHVARTDQRVHDAVRERQAAKASGDAFEGFLANIGGS